MFKDFEALPTDLLKYKFLFAQYAQFTYFETRSLINIANFMSKTPVTGLNTINNILRVTGFKIQPDAPYVKYLTKIILARELNMLFRRLRTEDMILSAENLLEFPEE